MHIYELRFGDWHDHFPRRVCFRAEDPGKALTLAHKENCIGKAELWEDDHKLCDLQRQPVGKQEIWTVTRADRIH